MLKHLLFTLLLTSTAYAQKCKGVKRMVDKFDGHVSYSKETEGLLLQSTKHGAIHSFMTGKVVAEGKTDTAYTIRPAVFSLRNSPEMSGRIDFLFSDGTKLRFDNQDFKTQYYASGSILSAFIVVSKDQFQAIIDKQLTDLRVGYLEGSVPKRLAGFINEDARCLYDTW